MTKCEREKEGAAPRSFEAEIALFVGCMTGETCTKERAVSSRLFPLTIEPSVVSAVHRGREAVTPWAGSDPFSGSPCPGPPGVVKTKIGALITGQIYHRNYRGRECARAREHVRGIWMRRGGDFIRRLSSRGQQLSFLRPGLADVTSHG